MFSPGGQTSCGSGCLRRLCSLYLERFPRCDWVTLWATWSGPLGDPSWPSLEQEVGLELFGGPSQPKLSCDPKPSFISGSRHFLWFCWGCGISSQTYSTPEACSIMALSNTDKFCCWFVVFFFIWQFVLLSVPFWMLHKFVYFVVLHYRVLYVFTLAATEAEASGKKRRETLWTFKCIPFVFWLFISIAVGISCLIRAPDNH